MFSWFGLERTSKLIQFQPNTFHYPIQPGLGHFRDEKFPASLGTLCKGLLTLLARNSFLSISWAKIFFPRSWTSFQWRIPQRMPKFILVVAKSLEVTPHLMQMPLTRFKKEISPCLHLFFQMDEARKDQQHPPRSVIPQDLWFAVNIFLGVGVSSR